VDEQDAKPESADRYLYPDTEILEELLDQLWDEGAMDIEELDGFFAALHCCPELVPPAEFIPVIVGDAFENKELFPNLQTADLFVGLILSYWNAVGDAFHSDIFFEPLWLEDDEGHSYGNNWAMGFMQGIEMRRGAWDDIFNDEDKFAWLIPILALVHEDDPDPEMRSYQEPVTEELREKLFTGVSAMVTRIYHYFAPHRKLNASAAAARGAPRQPKQKIGRNDPCYCGSGLKYKKCCGGQKIN
jgi:uncharacterized protein